MEYMDYRLAHITMDNLGCFYGSVHKMVEWYFLIFLVDHGYMVFLRADNGWRQNEGWDGHGWE